MIQDDPDNVDRLINDVARGMTAARVDDTFARRVSARLEEPDPRARRAWPRAWLLAPAAGAVLLAAILLSDRNVRLKPDATAVNDPGATAVGKPDATPYTVVAEIRQPETSDAARRSVTNTAQESVAPPPASDFPVEPLVTPPIEFAALDVSPLVTAMPIEIQAIAIERIEIPPMP